MTTAAETTGHSRWWTGIGLALVIGMTARLAGINIQSFWYDEAYSARIASSSTAWELLTGAQKDNGNPPLYYLAHHLISPWFGNSEAGHRLFAALCGLLTVPIVGLLGRRLGGDRTGLIAAWLFALSPLSVELSNEARVYSCVHLLCTLDALLLLNWLTSQRWRDGLAYLVVTALTCYTHYFVVFFVLSHLCAVIAVPQRVTVFGRWCVLMLGVAVLWSPWVPAFLEQVTTPGNFSRMSHAWVMQFASTPVVFSVGRTFAWRDSGPYWLALAGGTAVIGFWLPAATGWLRLRRISRPEAVLCAGWLLFPILIPFAVALTLSPVYHHRYGSVGLPAFVCLAALGLDGLSKSWRSLPVTAVLCGTCFSLTNYYTQPVKDDWRSAARQVLARQTPGKLLLTDQSIEVLPFLYYAERANQVPAEAYGLTYLSGTESFRLHALKYVAGQKQDQQPVDHTDRIVSAPSICLALCIPERDPAEYLRLFEQYGYVQTAEESFYRIRLIHFERATEVADRAATE